MRYLTDHRLSFLHNIFSQAHRIKKRCFGGRFSHAYIMNYRPPNSVFKYGGICLCWLLTAPPLRMLCSEHQKPNVYHPIDNPNSRSDLYLLKNSECPFIQHDSVLKLNDLRTLSVNRILYKQKMGKWIFIQTNTKISKSLY